MQRRLLLAATSAAFLLIYIGVGCTKFDTTKLGSDLITVDNVNTFADTLTVNATQGYFNDSTILQKGDNHVVGAITTDPLFGGTDARIYVQFKPTFYPFYFGNAGDTVRFDSKAGFDSAFVTLSYKGAWGDTSSISNIPQTFEVRAINDVSFWQKNDTLKPVGSTPPTVDGDLLGSAIINPAIIAQKVFLAQGKDSVVNQIRIKLTGAGATYAAAIFNGQDTLASSTTNGFLNDSIFRQKFNGFEIRVKSSTSGNTLYYVNIGEAKSRLEFHFHKTKIGVRDTVVQSFQMYTTTIGAIASSSSRNYVKRDYTSASQPLPLANTTTNNVFLQTAPGTFANLIIPGLTGYSNRIVHRAYLIVEQTPDNIITDKIYTAPPFLYLDLKDTLTSIPQRYKPLYFDLSSTVPYNPDVVGVNGVYHPFPFGNVTIQTFGGNELKRFETSGTPFSRYEFNITRYVQHIVTDGYKNYDLRLYAPFNYYYPQYLGTQYIIPFYNPIALGRVRVGTGSNANHKMKLVVVYSKI